MNTTKIMGVEFTTMMTKADRVTVTAVGALAGFSTAMWIGERIKSKHYRRMYGEINEAAILLCDSVNSAIDGDLTEQDVRFTLLALNTILDTDVSMPETTEQD